MKGKPALRACIVLLMHLLCVPAVPEEQSADGGASAPVSGKETLQYGVEWRLIRAGLARLSWEPHAVEGKPGYEGKLHLESAGLVSKLYKVNDDYTAQVSEQLCAETTYLRAIEGKRNRETKVTIDRARGKAHYLERDLNKNTTVLAKNIDVPSCVHEIVSGLYKMRTLRLQPGQTAQVPVTDGKKFVQVKVDALERETIKTPTGNHNTIKHEAFIFNNVLFSRSGRCYVWLTDDARRTPVQIQVKMRFLIGTVTLTLEKEERS